MSITTTITICGQTYPLSRDVRDVHPSEVHEALGTDSESELQNLLDHYVVDEYYKDGRHLGPDSDGVSLSDGREAGNEETEMQRGIPENAQVIGTIHTSGGPDDWAEVHRSMRARGWTSTTEDSYWHNGTWRCVLRREGLGARTIWAWQVAAGCSRQRGE
jgi:hypothetical protein